MRNDTRGTNSELLDLRTSINDSFGKNDFDSWLLDKLELREGISVLDIGCGTGKHLFKISELLTNKGYVLGMDIDEQSLQKCRERIVANNVQNIELRKSDLTEIGKKINVRFDRILSSFAVYYTKDKDKTFNDCYKLLKRGGLLFFCGPAKGNNTELLGLVENSGITPSDDFLLWTNFLEKQAKPLLEQIFGNIEVSFFENPIDFPSEDEVYKYWESTALYDEKKKDAFKMALRKEFKKNKKFVNTKIVIGLRCRK